MIGSYTIDGGGQEGRPTEIGRSCTIAAAGCNFYSVAEFCAPFSAAAPKVQALWVELETDFCSTRHNFTTRRNRRELGTSFFSANHSGSAGLGAKAIGTRSLKRTILRRLYRF